MKFVLPIVACFGLFVSVTFAGPTSQPTSQPTTQPSISVGNISVIASPTGGKAVFTVSLNAPAPVPVVVNYATVAGTASSGNGDYLGIPSGSVVVPAGQTTATVSVAIKPHTTLDGPKTFQLSVTASVPTTVEVGASGIGTIIPPVIIPPASQPSALTITAAGTYTGSYSAIAVNAGETDNVIIDHVTCDSIVCNKPTNLTITNCTISGANADYSVAVWSFVNVVIENNQVTGPGILVQDSSGKYVSATSRYNRGVNIAGPIVSGQRTKRSFIQYFKLQKGGLIMDWNETEGTRGVQAMEDAFSFCQCSGTATSRASMCNNFCGGNWDNPVITAESWKKGVGFSGSEFMVADPGGDLNLTTGTNIDASGNIGIDCENQGVVMAYGYGNRMWDNLVVKDGTGSTFGTEPAQIFNWSVKKDVGATPVNLFATNTQFYGNQYNWLVEGKPIEPIIDSKVDQSLAPNTQVNTTQAQARALWQANVQAKGVTIGPK